MRTSIKVLLIVLAIVSAVCAVLYYLKSKVDPPKALQTQNYAYEEIATRSNEVDWKALDDANELRRQYHIQRDLMNRLREDQHLTHETRDAELVSELYTRYGSQLVAIYQQTTSRSSWHAEKLTTLSPYITELEQLRDPEGALLLSQHPDLKGEVEQFHQLQRDLTRGLCVAHRPFTNIESAREDLKTMERLRQDEKLKRCKELSSCINDPKRSFNKKHCEYLKSQVNGLARYSEQNRDQYNQVKKHIEEYRSKAEELYGDLLEDFNSIEKELKNKVNQATEHYNSTPSHPTPIYYRNP